LRRPSRSASAAGFGCDWTSALLGWYSLLLLIFPLAYDPLLGQL
jgi:hypothetical protein